MNKAKNLESPKNARVFRDKRFFVKEVKIDLFGYLANAYIILDPELRSEKIDEFVSTYCEEAFTQNKNQSKLEYASCGIVVFASSKPVSIKEILSFCYTKQSIEQILSSKNELNTLSSSSSADQDKMIQGCLFLQFLLLTLYFHIKEQNRTKHTIEQMLMILRALKCKLFDDQVIPQEALEEQAEILQKYNILVPTSFKI